MEAAARRAIEDRNHAAVDRLRALGVRLSDEELSQTIDPPWTAAALFAHMAFWDRFVRARWLLAATTGSRTPLPFDDALLELINDSSLQQWAVIPPRTAVQDCLAAAAEIDGLIGRSKPMSFRRLCREGESAWRTARYTEVSTSVHHRDSPPHPTNGVGDPRMETVPGRRVRAVLVGMLREDDG
jgi:hypothetical protein